MTDPGEYPFDPAKQAPFADGQRLSAAAATRIDKNAAAAASGKLWTDLAIAHNINDQATVANCGYSPIWVPFNDSGAWLSFGVSSGNPVYSYSLANGDWSTAADAIEEDGLTPGAHGCSATDGTIVLFGGTPGSASTKKIRRSLQNYPLNEGFGFFAEDTVASGTEGVRSMIWHEESELFVIGLSNAVATNIETSPDGQTWTQRTGSNSLARGAMATSGEVIILLSTSSTNQCLRSVDGINWTTETLPSTAVWLSVVWDSFNEKFLAFSATSWAWSSDGENWTAGDFPEFGTGGFEFVGPFTAFGRVLLGWSTGCILTCGFVDASNVLKIDAVYQKISGSARGIAAGAKQFLATAGTTHLRTIRGGFFASSP